MGKKFLVIVMSFILLATAACKKADKTQVNSNTDDTPSAANSITSSPDNTDNNTPESTPDNNISESGENEPTSTPPGVNPISTQNNTGKSQGNSTPKPTHKPAAQPVSNANIPAPSDLDVKPAASGGAILTWSGGSGKYQVKISTDNKNFSDYGEMTTDKYIVLKNLKANTLYYIRVYSVDADNRITSKYASIGYKYTSSQSSEPNNNGNATQKPGNTGNSNPTSKPGNTATQPDNPEVFIYDDISVGVDYAIIMWYGGTGKYQVKISTDNKNFTNYGGVTSDSFCILNNLKEGTKYYVRVYNVINNAVSSKYDSVSFTTKEIGKPELSIKSIGYSNVSLSWTGDSEYYLIMLSTNGKDYEKIEHTFIHFTDIYYLSDNTKYWVRVYNSDSKGNVSNKYDTVEFTTKSMPVPNNLKVSSVTLNEATVSWSGGTGNYNLVVYEANNPNNIIFDISTNSTSKKLTNLKSNTRYKVVIYSVDEHYQRSKGYSTAEFTTKVISAPQNLTVSYVSPHGAIISWAPENYLYQVKISTNGTNFEDYGNNSSISRRELINLKKNTKYWVRVYPVGYYNGEVGQPAEITFTTGKSNLPQKQNQTYTTYLSSNNKKDYLQISLLSDGIEFKGATLTSYKKIWVIIEDKNTNKTVDSNIYIDISSDRTFYYKYKKSLSNGQYIINVNYGPNKDNWYWTLYEILMTKKDGKMYFTQSEVYNHNYDSYKGSNYFTLGSIELSLSDADKKKIRDQALSITKGITGDYDKVFAISKWVAENIYYDYDMFNGVGNGVTDPVGTLEKKRSVCQGYAELTAALLKSINIPCKIVTGYAMGVGTDGDWSKVGKNATNHAWNEVYVDGRWIIIDTTWNSGNRYENGKFIKGDINYKYFDITLEALSYSHKIVN